MNSPQLWKSAAFPSPILFERSELGFSDKVVDPSFPIVIFGVTAFAAGVLALFLPETQHRKMPDTIEDGEAVPVSLRDGFLKGSKVSAETAEA